MIKIYTDYTFLNKKYRRQIFPLLLDLHFLKDNTLLEYFELVDNISESDVVVFPINYVQFLSHRKELNNLLLLSKKNDKPIWLYTGGDYGLTTYIANSYVFRLGGFDSKLDKKTFIMPSFINDPYFTHLKAEFKPIKKEEKPSIGFVGHAQSGILKYIKEYINFLKYTINRTFKFILADKQSFYPSSIKRAYYLDKLRKSEFVNTEFMMCKQYRDGVKTEEDKIKSAQIFYNNIYNNAYTFCLRGVGNFSVRFYETLATGRIPILIDTDCRLPLENIIDWSKHCVIINKNDSLEEQILSFHNKLSNLEFVKLQELNRELWLNFLRRDSYYKLIYQEFIKYD
ncbi:exostosin family protein [Mariniflexile sp.]|uniref:exostosin domain-containing protein n=1 Tax=Mariniflexile sp. TaxID=1979402 RepID=UPI00356B2CE2